jgi:hypothetical protein
MDYIGQIGIYSLTHHTKGSVSFDAAVAALQVKLHPRRFPSMTGRMIAFTIYLIGLEFEGKGIAEVAVNYREGHIYFRATDDCGFNDLQSYAAAKNNWFGLIDFPGVGLTRQERNLAAQLFNTLPTVPGTSKTRMDA